MMGEYKCGDRPHEQVLHQEGQHRHHVQPQGRQRPGHRHLGSLYHRRFCKNGIESVRRNAPVAALEDQTVEGFATEKCPKFEMYVDKAGEFRFRLKATNGEIIAASEGYKAKESCENGIASVRENAPVAEMAEE